MRGAVRIGMCAVVSCIAVAASGQTNDDAWGSSRAGQVSVGPEGLAMGGAYVGVTDAASAIMVNPASLATLTRIEFFGSARRSGGADVHGNDRLGRTALGLIGGAGRITPRVAIGGYIVQPRSVETRLNGLPYADGSYATGYLRSVATDAGGAIAYQLRPRLSLGLHLMATHLELEGATSRFGANGAKTVDVGTSSGSTRVMATIAALYEASESLSMGVSASPGASWSADRSAVSPTLGALDPGSEYEVRRPSTISVGAAWRAHFKVLVVGQVDYVRYGEVRDALRITQGSGSPSEYAASGALEPRVGVEYSHAWSNTISSQLRAGVRSSAPDQVLKYQGADSARASVFPGVARATSLSFGGSVVVGNVRVHAAGDLSDDQPLVSLGVTARF